MRIPKALRVVGGVVVVAALGSGVFFTRHRWMPLVSQASAETEVEEQPAAPAEEPSLLELSAQARKNMGLVAKPARTQTYWKKVQIPGVIVDRPGKSDRGITSPAVGVVTQIHAFPGDTVKPGYRLFSLRLFSEYLQKTQKELFEASRETELLQAQIKRLQPLAESGGIAPARIIELENQLQRQAAVIEAHRQDLLTRGLSPEQIAVIAAGKFVTTVEVNAPPPVETAEHQAAVRPAAFHLSQNTEDRLAYEVQELAVELGQQVQAGSCWQHWPITSRFTSRGMRSSGKRRRWSGLPRMAGS